MKELKHKTRFSSIVKPVISKDTDMYLAKASLEQLRAFIPNIDLDANYDILAVAFNLFDVNRFNRNDDGVDTAFALKVYKSFVNKYINIEHARERVIGTILTANITELGTDKLLTEKDVEGTKDIFNITVGGIIWRVVNPDLVETIENSNSLLSDNYKKIFASLELAFSDFKIVKCAEGCRNLSEGKLIEDPEEIEGLSNNLRVYGGTGKTKDGSRIYRLLSGEGVGLGAGLVENPAAFVGPIAVDKPEEEKQEAGAATQMAGLVSISTNSEGITQTTSTASALVIDLENKISLSDESNVITNKNSNSRKHMKINSIKDINDELLKECKASAIIDFVETELKAASEKYAKEQKEKEALAQEIEKKHQDLLATHETLKKELENIKANLEKLEQEKQAKDKQEKFNVRMASFEDKFELSEEELSVVASQIKDVSDEDYAKVEANLSVLLKNKDKKVLAAQKKVKEEAKASVETKGDIEVSVEKALEKAEGVSKEIPATSSVQTPTLREKFAKAFAPDQFEVTR